MTKGTIIFCYDDIIWKSGIQIWSYRAPASHLREDEVRGTHMVASDDLFQLRDNAIHHFTGFSLYQVVTHGSGQCRALRIDLDNGCTRIFSDHRHHGGWLDFGRGPQHEQEIAVGGDF